MLIVLRGRALVLLLGCLIALATAARADDTHYQDFVVGGRAVGLGGAFTSLADDASGLYYNPAGIADVRHTDLQLSTSLYGFEHGSINARLGLPVPGAENLDVAFTDLIIVPSSAGFVKTFGAPGPDGLPRQAYGLSVVVPSFRSFAAGAPSPTDAEMVDGTVTTYQRRVTDRELWTGLGYGRKWNDRLRVGVSAYYVLRTLLDREDVTQSADNAAGQQSFRAVTNDIALVSGALIFIAGAKLKLGRAWALGASIQAPSLSLHSQATLRFSSATSDLAAAGGPASSFVRPDQPSAASRTRYAPAARVGASYQRPYKYTLSADLSLHGPVSYTLVEVDEALRQRLPFEPDISRRAVLNGNVGGEYLIVREVSVAAGFFTDFSSAPPIGANPSADQPPNVDLFGMSLSLGYFSEHTLSRIGLVYSFGRGRDVIPGGAGDIDRVLNGEQQFRRVAYVQQFFYIFVASTFRY